MFNYLEKLKNLGYYPKNILDIGAYKGIWTKTAMKTYPDSNYMLFEAINYDELKQFKNLKNVDYSIQVLSDIEKIVEWYEKKNTGDSLFRENTKYFEDCEIKLKKTVTLDNFFEQKISNIWFDFIKIDTQGSEIPILKGGKNLIKKTNIIMLELPFFCEYNKGVSNFLDHIQFMDSIGFVPYDIVELHRAKGILIQIDLIFIRKNHDLIKKKDNISYIHSKLLSCFDREHVINYVKNKKRNNKNYKVIDIGGSAEYTNWSYEIIDYIIDINPPQKNNHITYFNFNVNFESEWNNLFDYVKKNGKFDFCICSHIIEDISLPQVLINNLQKIANEGFIAIPSKYRELSKIEGDYLGYIHHRWIYTFYNNELLAFPKVNFIDKTNFLIEVGDDSNELLDLSFFWKNNINLKIINNNYLGPNKKSVINYYKKLINDDTDKLKDKIKLYKYKNNIEIDYIFHINKLKNYININSNINIIIVLIEFDYKEFLNNIQFMDSIDFIPYDIAELHRERGNLIQIDLIFIRKNHDLISKSQLIINNLG